jgi:hypothetical protein
LPIAFDPGFLPAGLWGGQHLIQLRSAFSNHARSAHLMGLACWGRGVKTSIKAQRGDERDLLLSAGRSQLDNTVGAITNQLESSIGEPSAYQVHELFCPVWNGFVSAS